MQYKPNQNCHYESSLYNACILKNFLKIKWKVHSQKEKLSTILGCDPHWPAPSEWSKYDIKAQYTNYFNDLFCHIHSELTCCIWQNLNYSDS
jgi:hypothetical protein